MAINMVVPLARGYAWLWVARARPVSEISARFAPTRSTRFLPQDAPDDRFQKATADTDYLRSMPQLFRTRARGSSSSGSHFASKPYILTLSAADPAQDCALIDTSTRCRG